MKYTVFLLCILLCGCCRKKDCDDAEEPRINLKISKDAVSGFSEKEIREMKVKIIGKTFTFLDSVQPFPLWDHGDHISMDAVITLDRNFLVQVGHHDIQAFDFVWQFDSTHSYLIDRISYETASETIDCNGCLFSDGSGTVSRVIQLSYYLDNVYYNGMNTVALLEK